MKLISHLCKNIFLIIILISVEVNAGILSCNSKTKNSTSIKFITDSVLLAKARESQGKTTFIPISQDLKSELAYIQEVNLGNIEFKLNTHLFQDISTSTTSEGKSTDNGVGQNRDGTKKNSQVDSFDFSQVRRFELSLENGESKLKAIRINYTGERNVISQAVLNDYAKFLSVFTDMELWVVVSQNSFNALSKAVYKLPDNISNRIKIVNLFRGSVLEHWAQDGSKPMVDGKSTLMQKAGNKVNIKAYETATTSLQMTNTAAVHGSDLRFEGGNIIVANKHIFVGTDIVNGVMADFLVSRKDALSILEIQFGKEIIEVGTPLPSGELAQASFHIDLDMAVVNSPSLKKDVVLLQSVSDLFVNVLKFSKDFLQDSNSFDSARKNYFKKTQDLIKKNERGELRPNEKHLFSTIARLKFEEVKLIEEKSKFIESTVLSHGYEVVRVPGISIRSDKTSLLSIFNYTNIIVSGSNIISPTYKVDYLDDFVYGIFKKLGFSVHKSEAAEKLLCYHGGIRCASETYRFP